MNDVVAEIICLMHSVMRATGGRMQEPFSYSVDTDPVKWFVTWDTSKYHLEVIVSHNWLEWYGSDGTFEGAFAVDSKPGHVPEEVLAFLPHFVQ